MGQSDKMIESLGREMSVVTTEDLQIGLPGERKVTGQPRRQM